ncbi:MAG: glycosyltransferase, partial [Planctomycetales bacterium]|nr:glycosyltransferase [Planctomycetales bacterium]
MNVFAFPSHREGLPVAPLEAAATGIPTVTTRSTGCIDAVIDGETGFVVDVGDVQALANALIRYLQDEKLRTSHGHAAREFVKKHFDQQTVWKLIESEYRSLLAARNLPIG